MATITGSAGNDTLIGDTTLPGTANDSISGGNGDDLVIGLSANDTLNGDAGNDQLFGGTGNDFLFGGTGDDTLDGGPGRDSIVGGDGNDYIFESDFQGGASSSGSGRDTIDGGAGIDTVDFSFAPEGIVVTLFGGNASVDPSGFNNTDVLISIENIVGTAFADSITGDSGPNFLSGGGGNDVIRGGDGNDTIAGGLGNDVLAGDAGIDTLTYASSSTAVNANLGSATVTGEGTDSISGFENLIGSDLSDTLTGTAGANVISGLAGNDTIQSGDGADTIFGGAGNDSILAGAGNDIIDGGTGRDTIDGGTGDDLIFGGSSAPAGTTYIVNGDFSDGGAGWTGTDLEFNPESSYFGGGNSNLVAEIDGNAQQITQMNQSFGVDGPASAQLTFRGIVRTAGQVGTDGYLVEVLDASNTVVATRLIIPPSNSVWTNYTLDVIFPAAGTYTLRFTEVGNDNSIGALVDDVQITSTSMVDDVADTLSGGDGADTIFGGAGGDAIFGGIGADSIDGGTGNDNIQAGSDNDTVLGGAGDDTILGDGGDDQLAGGDGNDRLEGGGGSDAILGDSGDDVIFGEGGNDTITGGTGNDTVFGGDGNDVFVVGLNDVTTVAGNDVDTVPAYEVIYGGGGGVNALNDNDTIDLSAFGFSRVQIVRNDPNPLNAGHEDGFIRILDSLGNEIARIDFFNIENIFPCFTPGVMILTDRGEVPVEALVPGDMVMTRDNGLQPLRWVGRRDLSLLDLMADPDLQPVQIAAGALHTGPDRVMRVSPQHRVLIEGARAELVFGEAEVLVAAKHLLGQAGVTRVLPLEGVAYIHILFDRHEIVQSDGVWTESFQPAERMLSAMEAEVRAEVLKLFPQLAEAADAFPAARPSLKAHEARVLLAD